MLIDYITDKSHKSSIITSILLLTLAIVFLNASDTFATSYSIIYDDNVVSGMPTDVNDKTFGTTVSVSATIPTRSGYSNIGWCSVIPTYLNGVDTCTGGTQYDASDDLTIDQTGSSNDFHLYAMWGPPCALSQYVMQNVSEWGSSVTSGNEVTACDNRDGKTYTVARLDDNNLWMTQNLDFDIVNGGAAIDSTNTDVPNNWANAGNLANTHATSDTTWNDYTDAPESYDPGDLYWNGQFGSNSGAAPTGDSHYHLGNYYNWTAAVAMANSSSYTGNTDVNQSICPSGWMLPKLENSGSFEYLVEQYGWDGSTLGNDTKIWNTPLYFPLSGYWRGNSLYLVGGESDYWSSVVIRRNTVGAFYADYDGYIYPLNLGTRTDGFSVRCVAR